MKLEWRAGKPKWYHIALWPIAVPLYVSFLLIVYLPIITFICWRASRLKDVLKEVETNLLGTKG